MPTLIGRFKTQISLFGAGWDENMMSWLNAAASVASSIAETVLSEEWQRVSRMLYGALATLVRGKVLN